MSTRGLPTDERFWSLTDTSGDCWLWTASRFHSGYGYFKLDGKGARAHRVAYELEVGPIPEGMQVDHICHVPACVRPEHLRLATNKQNQENSAGPYATSKSGVRGVSWSKESRKWRAAVRHNSKSFYIGLFESIAEAEAAVIAKRLELFTHNDLDRRGS